MIAFVIGIYAFFIGCCITGYIVGKVAYEEGVQDERRGWYIHAHRHGWKEEDFKY